MKSKASLFSTLLLLAGALPALAQTPATGSWRDEIRRLRDGAIAPAVRGGTRQTGVAGKHFARRHPIAALVASSLNGTVAETEPNDSIQNADSAALGDRATGVISHEGDVDVWSVDLTAGQFFSVDVDAAEAGSTLDPALGLFAPDGRTLLAFNDDFDGLDSRISYPVPTSGRYYVAIRSFNNAGSATQTYALNLGTVTCRVPGTDREPDDTPATANRIAVGDSVTGEVCAEDIRPTSDLDYWAFIGQAGTTIRANVLPVGVVGCPIVTLYASDGTTRLVAGVDANAAGNQLKYSITTTGIYYAVVSTAFPDNPVPYSLHLRAIPQGPGDPIAVRGDGLGILIGIAAGNTGDLFATDIAGNRVVRITSQGVTTTFAPGIQSPLGLAFDAFGNLLVVSLDAAVYRITPDGHAVRFITDAGLPAWIAVGPDGRIWISDVSDRSLRRYSPTGQFEARFDLSTVGGSGPGPIAITASGEPWFSTGTEIWKLVNGQPRRVLSYNATIWGFAFDVAGNIYAPDPNTGRITLLDPTGRVLSDPFAVGPDSPEMLAFGRDATGATVARLFATDRRLGRVIEVNPAGVALPGLPVGFVAAGISVEAAAAELLGGAGLTPADLQLLDAAGNHNGRYDVGDFQALLRSLGDPLTQLHAGRAP